MAPWMAVKVKSVFVIFRKVGLNLDNENIISGGLSNTVN